MIQIKIELGSVNMNLIKVEGIVVGEQSYLESSKILKIFTKDLGIISVLSKGSKKPKSDLKEGSNKLICANFTLLFTFKRPAH